MKNRILFLIVLMSTNYACSQTKVIEWVTTTRQEVWVSQPVGGFAPAGENADIVVDLSRQQQVIDGFGSCFNELGWISLNTLEEADREAVMKELFAPGIGANFTICRMPVGANDFARDWYSYNETAGDFDMTGFSIAHDKSTLIPFIKNALKYNPDLKIWASPWSPPSWMKYNKHYASRSSAGMREMIAKLQKDRVAEEPEAEAAFQYRFKLMLDPKYQNDLPPDREGKEGTDMFIREDRYLRAYALYFSKFIDAYRSEGINIFMVMPQNEFNSAQVFPSCCWTAAGLADFIGSYLGPAMSEKGVDIFFGTMERPSGALADTVLQDEKSGKYVKGVGFQWAGKDALPGISRRYPDLKYYQTEQECGDGKNDWQGAMHAWNLMKHYLGNGVSVYEYWNTSLPEGGISRWGWAQNSLVVVDPEAKTFRYTYEYYMLKHVSHYVQPGAKKIETGGEYRDVLAFLNSDDRIVVIAANQDAENRSVDLKIGNTAHTIELKANSINTFLIK